MRLNGYLEHVDLGIDPESGERNLLVQSATEFYRLPEDQHYRAWAVVKVAAEILERPAMTLYQHVYQGKLASKVIKKNAFDRHGLTLIKPYQSMKDRKARREQDQMRIERNLKRSLDRTPWLSRGHQALIVAIVGMKLREFERELLKDKKNKGIEGDGSEQQVTA